MSKFIKYSFFTMSDSGLTKIYTVTDINETVILGYIKWHGAWRKYTFHPEAKTLFDVGCLIELSTMLEEITRSYKEEKKNAHHIRK